MQFFFIFMAPRNPPPSDIESVYIVHPSEGPNHSLLLPNLMARLHFLESYGSTHIGDEEQIRVHQWFYPFSRF